MAQQQVGRNDPCPCGSGKKYKRCHWAEDQKNRVTRGSDGEVQGAAEKSSNVVLWAVAGLFVLAGVVLTVLGHFDWGVGVGVGGLILLGAYAIIRDPPPPNKDSGDPSGINFGG